MWGMIASGLGRRESGIGELLGGAVERVLMEARLAASAANQASRTHNWQVVF